MDLQGIIAGLQDCPCGRPHACELRAVEADSGNVRRAGALLKKYDFPRDILFVADQNTLRAAHGIEKSLADAGFHLKYKLYDDLRTADMQGVREIEEALEGVSGVLSVGTGSLNDICRLASFNKDKDFAIFATAPSMDGFASGSAPITIDNFKRTVPAKQPSVILADTEILAHAPAELKSAGFGDMIAKYIGLVDWRASQLLTGEYLCPRVFDLTQRALLEIVAMADKILPPDETAAAAVLESLILTGVAMRVTNCTRPGSGTEHIISHFWECKKLLQGQISDFHGKKCGVATLIVNEIYHHMAEAQNVRVRRETPDWDEIAAAYGPEMAPEMLNLNRPAITDDVDMPKLEALWPDFQRLIRTELPTQDELLSLMHRAGCAVSIAEIGVTPALGALGVKYHPFMRRRMTIMRLRGMLGFPLADAAVRL